MLINYICNKTWSFLSLIHIIKDIHVHQTLYLLSLFTHLLNVLLLLFFFIISPLGILLFFFLSNQQYKSIVYFNYHCNCSAPLGRRDWQNKSCCCCYSSNIKMYAQFTEGWNQPRIHGILVQERKSEN